MTKKKAVLHEGEILALRPTIWPNGCKSRPVSSFALRSRALQRVAGQVSNPDQVKLFLNPVP